MKPLFNQFFQGLAGHASHQYLDFAKVHKYKRREKKKDAMPYYKKLYQQNSKKFRRFLDKGPLGSNFLNMKTSVAPPVPRPHQDQDLANILDDMRN